MNLVKGRDQHLSRGTLFIMSVYATVSELVISIRQSNHDGKDEKN
jgi:hypothetical protein